VQPCSDYGSEHSVLLPGSAWRDLRTTLQLRVPWQAGVRMSNLLSSSAQSFGGP